ncbi:MAG: hypothetical protein AB7S65_07755 [Sulfuricurvum sp.]
MELKDVILSTLAEIEELSTPAAENNTRTDANHNIIKSLIEKDVVEEVLPPLKDKHENINIQTDEIRMLEGIRERLLVLFEGFQSPNNVRIEAKVDLTLNFLEYLLATIDNRLETIKE